MRAPWVVAGLVALGAAAAGLAHADGLDGFQELARRYAEAADPDTLRDLGDRLFALVDGEVIENLRSGGPFASAPFIRERLEALGDEWGGAAFRIVRPQAAARGALTLGLFTLTRTQPLGSFRVYGGGGAARLLAAATHEGAPDAHVWTPRSGAAAQFVVTWVGAPDGRRSRRGVIEVWRQTGPAAVARVWTSAEAFPDGLQVVEWRVQEAQIRIRYEVRYPGWKPGCPESTEQEDVYGGAPGGEGLVLRHRRVVNGWHRELQTAVTRFFEAMAGTDDGVLAELIPDAALRRRLPRPLASDPVCDVAAPGAAGGVLVGATHTDGGRPVPWALTWRRGPRGWRLAAATPVLQ